jgi:hypothetical protein
MIDIQHKRHLTLGLAVTIALTMVLLLRHVLPAPPVIVGVVPTGASFNLTLGSFADARQAGIVAANAQATGLPVFTRSVRRRWRQVIVGPFVSIDEAETAQRALVHRGFVRPRMLVDESIRRTPGIQLASFDPANPLGSADAPGLVMVAAAGRVSVVFELPVEPRHIATRRASGSVIEVDAGPVATPVPYQEWAAPDGVTLVNQISLLEGDGGAMRARVSTPALTHSNVRVLGRRVYIDLWSPDAREPDSRRRPDDRRWPEGDRRHEGLLYRENETGTGVAGGLQPSEYRDVMTPIVARVGEIEPFLMSAVQSPAPEVLAAVNRTLRAVQDQVAAVQAPQDSAGTHTMLVNAINLVTQAADPGFDGDRVAQARQALTLFDATAATLRRPPSPAPQP